MAATCKSCGASIIWIQAPSNKWIPCDEGLKPYKQDANGKDYVVNQKGEVILCTLDFDGTPTGMARTAHFATCPDAAKFRRQR